MKELKNLKGAKMLGKKEQKAIKGGGGEHLCENGGLLCPKPLVCIDRVCVHPFQ